MNSIDERIVEMQFNNSQFEKGAKESISTLDKLRKALKLEGVTSGIENVQTAIKNVDVSSVGNGIEEVRAKFSALDVMAASVLNNITNSAINAGKRMVSSLSVDQVTAGWGKYEEKTASVQTIMNATGKSIDQVNNYLSKLMWFSDETSYGFTDMTAALGQLTSSGGDIDKLIPMITGVANATAYAGKGANEFSRTIYNLSQSYGAGYLQLMDWKSFETAGVGSKALKQSLIDVAVELGKIKEGEITVANFSESLKKKWADTEVMEKAFGKFSELSEAAYEIYSDNDGNIQTSKILDTLSGKYDTLAEKAFKSAQEAKSFSEAIDATKDAVSSGWMSTFEIIFGNYEQAKVMWTDLANTLWDVFASGAESRNNLLEDALYSNWDKFKQGIIDAGSSVEELDNSIEKTLLEQGTTRSVLDYLINKYGSYSEAVHQGAIANSILIKAMDELNGTSVGALDDISAGMKMGDSGEDVKKVQEALQGLGYELKQFGADGQYGSETIDALEAFQKASGLEITGIIDEATLAALQEATSSSNAFSDELYDLATTIDELGGRELILETIGIAWEKLTTITGKVKEAFTDIFPPMEAENLFSIIQRVHDFTENITISNDALKSIKSTFTGVFSVFKMAGSVAGVVVKAFLPLLSVFKSVGSGILSASGMVGEFLTNMEKKASEIDFFGKMLTSIQNGISSFGSGIKNVFTAVTNALPRNFVNGIKASFNTLKSGIDPFIESLRNFDIQGIKTNGLNLLNKALLSLKIATLPLREAFDSVKTSAINFWTKIKTMSFDQLKTKAVDKFSGALDKVKNGFSKLSDILKTKSLTEIKDIIGEKVSGSVAKLKDKLIELNPEFKDVFDKMSVSFDNAKQKIKSFAEEITGIPYEELRATIGEKLNTAFNNLKETLGPAGESISTLGKSIYDFFINNKEDIVGFFLDFGQSAKDAFDSITTFAESIPEKLTNLWESFTGFIDSVKEKYEKNPLIESLTESEDVEDAGKAFETKIEAVFSAVIETLKEKLSEFSLGDILSGIFNKDEGEDASEKTGISGWISGFVQGILDKITQLKEDIVSAVTTAKDNIVNTFSAIVQNLPTIGIAAGVVTGLVAIWKAISMVSSISKMFTSIQRSSNIKSLAIAIGVLAAALVALSLLDADGLRNAVIALTVSLGVLLGFTFALEKITKENASIKSVGIGLLAMVGAIGGLMGIIYLLNSVEVSEYERGLKAVAAIIAGMIAVSFVLSKISMGWQTGVALLALSAAVGVLYFAVQKFSTMKWEDLKVGLLAVAGALIALGIASRLLGKSSEGMLKMGGAMVLMAFAVNLLVPAIKSIGEMDLESAAKGVGAIAVILIAMGAMSAIGSINGGAKLLTMVGMVAAIVAIGYTISQLKDMDVDQVDAIGTALLKIIGILTLFEGVSSLNNLKSAGSTILMVVGVVGSIGLLLYALKNLVGVEESVTMMDSLWKVFASIAALTAASALGGIAGAGAIGIAAVVGIVSAIVVVAGLLAEIPGFGDVVNGGLDILCNISTRLGEAIGGFVEGVASTALSGFTGESAQGLADFITTLGSIDKTTLDNAKNLIAGFDGVIPDTGFFEYLITGTNIDWTAFGVAIGDLGTGFKTMADAFSGENALDEASIDNMKTAISALTDLDTAIPSTGWTGIEYFFTGTNTKWSGFGNGVEDLGEGLSAISKSFVGEDTFNPTAVDNMKTAVTALTELDPLLPTEPLAGIEYFFTGTNTKWSGFGNGVGDLGDGLKKMTQAFTGDNVLDEAAVGHMKTAITALTELDTILPEDGFTAIEYFFTGTDTKWSSFGNGVGDLGDGLASFAKAVTGENEISEDQLKSAKNALGMLSAFDVDIPNKGLWDSLVSGVEWGTFASNIASLGGGLAKFQEGMGGSFDSTRVDSAISSIRKLAQVKVPESNFWDDLLTGNNYVNFETNVGYLGQGLHNFVEKIKGVDTAALSAGVTQIATMMTGVSSVSESMSDDFETVASQFSSGMSYLGDGLAEIVTNLKDPDTESTVKNLPEIMRSLTEAFNLMSAMQKVDADSLPDVSMFSSFLTDLGGQTETFLNAGISMVNAVGEGISETDLTETGTTSGTQFLTGLEGCFGTARTDGQGLGLNVVSGANSEYTSLYDAGINLALGFIAGLGSKSDAVYTAGVAIGKRGAQGVKDGAQEKSPSTLGILYGEFLGEGYVIGIQSMGDAVEDAGFDMGRLGAVSMSRALNSIADIMDSNLEFAPTITPVVDLSNIQNGATMINGMLGGEFGYAMDSINSINTSMNSRGIRATNDDVVNAIGALRKDIGGLQTNQYNINGITYDDGSNVSDAVSTLIRATRMERRVR